MILPYVRYLFACLLIMAPFAGAQDMGLGVKGGFQQSVLWDDPDSEFTTTNRFAFGIIFQHALSDRWAFQPELLYSKKGADLVDPDVFADLNYFRFNLDYLEIPLMLVFHGSPDRKIDPVIEIGAVPAVKLSSNVDSGTVEGGFTRKDKDDSVGNYDLGLAAGVGFEFPVGAQRLILSARYTLGVANIITGSSLSDQTPDPKRNRSLLFSIGTRF